MEKTEAARATMIGATLSLGVMTFQVDLISASRSKKNAASDVAKPTNVCPTCDTPSPLKQQLYCEAEHHGPFGSKDADKAMLEDGQLKKVDIEDIKAVKAAVADTKSIDLHVYPAVQVEAHTVPGGSAYRLRPQRNAKGAKFSAADVERYALVLQLVQNGQLAFIAEVGIKGSSSLYRCVAQDEALTLVGLVRPEELVPAALVEVPELPEISARLAHTGRAMVEESTEDFDPAAWADGIQAGLKKLREEAEAPSGTDTPANDTRTATAELVKLLNLAA